MNRRHLLRGLLGGGVASIGLPALEAMLLPLGRARATPLPSPDRFGVWFWGNGVRPEHWVPPSAGAGYSPSAELAPLADVLPWVSVVSGCEIKTATHPHHSGAAGILTGAEYHKIGDVRDTIATTFALPSVDMVAAAQFEGQTPFRSLEVGVTKFRGTDEGSTFQYLSHNGPNAPNPPEYDAVALYRRLFAVPTTPGLDLARQSVLDAVGDQVRSLQPRVSAADRVRLDQHLSSIRTLELRLAAGVNACSVPGEPAPIADSDSFEPIEEKNELMSQLLALALACDLTRAFSVLWSTAGSGVIVWQAGATDGLHSTCHFEPMPQPVVHSATVFTMENLAVFLRHLRDTPDGAGSLLDSVSLLCTSELTDGWTHSNQDFPILVAGKGNGRLRGGVHYRSPSLANTSHAVLTALRGGGVPLASFGTGPGYVETGVAELEV